MTVLSVLSLEVDWRTSVRRQDSAGAETRKGRVADNAAAPGSAASPRWRVWRQACRDRARSCAVTTATAIRPRCSRRPTAARRCSRCMPSITRSRGCARPSQRRCSARSGCNGGARSSRRPIRAAPARRHEVVTPLVTAIAAFGLTRAHLDRIIDTRERDLDDTPPADLTALIDYAEGTSSTLLFLTLEALGAAEPVAVQAAREVGIAYALAGLLRAMPFHAASGRSYIPQVVAVRTGLDPAAYVQAARYAGAAQSDRRVGRDGGGASRGGTAQRRSNLAAGAGRLVTGGDRRPVSAAAETGRVQPVRARTGRPRPAAKLAACRGGAAQPVLDSISGP